MANLVHVINTLHPDLELDRHFVVSDRGEGQFLETWNPPDNRPQPTQQQLDSVDDATAIDSVKTRKAERERDKTEMQALMLAIADVVAEHTTADVDAVFQTLRQKYLRYRKQL